MPQELGFDAGNRLLRSRNGAATIAMGEYPQERSHAWKSRDVVQGTHNASSGASADGLEQRGWCAMWSQEGWRCIDCAVAIVRLHVGRVGMLRRGGSA